MGGTAMVCVTDIAHIAYRFVLCVPTRVTFICIAPRARVQYVCVRVIKNSLKNTFLSWFVFFSPSSTIKIWVQKLHIKYNAFVCIKCAYIPILLWLYIYKLSRDRAARLHSHIKEYYIICRPGRHTHTRITPSKHMSISNHAIYPTLLYIYTYE